jgi:hypothetical protein
MQVWQTAVRLIVLRIGRAAMLPAASLLCSGIFTAAAAAQSSGADRLGVRNFVTATVSRAAGAGNGDADQRISGLLTVVRISNHARETQFYGDVPVPVATLDPLEQAPEQKIWEDERCHQRRGLPKASVISVSGTYERDQSHLEAVLRHIGLKLPADEIMPGQSLTAGRDNAGRYFSSQTRTSRSHVAILLKMYVIDCIL